jgi:hypothetical protein
MFKTISNVALSECLELVFDTQLSVGAGTSSKVDGHVLVSMKAIMHSAAESSTPVPMWITINSLLSKYEDFGDVFEKKNVDRLPKHRPYDCLIDLRGVSPPFGPIYGLSKPKF